MRLLCHHHHQLLHGSDLCFYLVQCESLLAPFPPQKKFFALDYATKAAGRGHNKQSDERGNRA